MSITDTIPQSGVQLLIVVRAVFLIAGVRLGHGMNLLLGVA